MKKDIIKKIKVGYTRFKYFMGSRSTTLDDKYPLPENKGIAEHPTVTAGLYIGLSIAFILTLLELGELGLGHYYPNLSEGSVLGIKLGAITFFLIYYGTIYQKILHKKYLQRTLKKRNK